MSKLYIFFLFLILANCSLKPVIKHHGVPSLEKKQNSLIISKTNKNDIIKSLGNPSTTSKFDNDVWIYIETKQTQSKLRKLGRMKTIENNVLVLEINDYGVLEKKKFYNLEDMKKLELTKNITKNKIENKNFIYNFFSSLRQKVNDPLGQRAKKRKEINQR